MIIGDKMVLEIPEWLTSTSVLGIIGAITGSLSLLIHFLNLKMAKPHLNIGLTECHHEYFAKEEGTLALYFTPILKIDNTGDRGTTFSEIRMVLTIHNKEYTKVEKELDKKVKAHDTIVLNQGYSFFERVIRKSKQQRNIKCSITIVHTHGKETIDGTSKIVHKSIFSLLK